MLVSGSRLRGFVRSYTSNLRGHRNKEARNGLDSGASSDSSWPRIWRSKRTINSFHFPFYASQFSFFSPALSYFEDSKRTLERDYRTYSTKGKSSGPYLENEHSIEGSSSMTTSPCQFGSTSEPIPSSSGNSTTTAQRQTRGVSTVIEPPVRTRPFRRSRGVPPTNHNNRRNQTPTKRVIVHRSAENENVAQSPVDSKEQQKSTIFRTPSPFVQSPTDSYASYPVVAIQISRSIDLSKVSSRIFAAKGVRKMRERLSVVAQLKPSEDGANSMDEAARFVAVFRFGSVVCFNVSPKDVVSLVEEVKTCATGLLSSQEERKDRFCVHVQPTSTTLAPVSTSQDESHDESTAVTADYCIVPELNMKSVDVISNVMAQSVALDSYNDTVDKLLADFERINNKVTEEGNLSLKDRDKMFRSVAQNNAIFLKLTKVGIKDREDTAWNLSQYENVSEGMREEFDIDRRFEHIEFKLNLIQQNAKFFLEVLANQKSDSLEWIIIVLILLECILMCVEMSGMGEPLFAYLGQFVPKPPFVS